MTPLSSYHDIAIEGHCIPLCSDGRLKAGDVLLMIDGKIVVDVEAVLESCSLTGCLAGGH